MHIVPSCKQCGNSFTTNRSYQKYCSSCIATSHVCIDCGATQHRSVRGPRCKKCADLIKLGTPNLKNRREEKPIEQIISEAETIGLLPEKQYAFGYVIGVLFGDGSVSKDISRNLKRSDGAPRVRPVTLYRVRLQVTSQAFAQRFVSQWAVLLGKTPNMWSTTRTNFDKSTLKGRSERYNLQLFNVSFAHALWGRYLTYLKHESDLYDLLRFPPDVMRGITHGMIDSEGYVNGKGRIDISNKRATLLDVLALMLESLGYKATVHTYPSNPVSHLITHMDYQKYIG